MVSAGFAERVRRTLSAGAGELLNGVADLAERVGGLGGVVDSADPDWTVDFAREGDRFNWSLRPQHSRAHTNSPVALSVVGDPAQLTAELRETIDRAVRFGTSDVIAIPKLAITSIRIDGPELIAGDYPPGDVELVKSSNTPGVGKPLELRLFDADGNSVASHEGVISHADTGIAGGCIEGKFCEDRLHVKVLIPLETMGLEGPRRVDAGAHMSVDLSRPGRPSVIREVLATARLVHLADRIELRVDGQPATSMAKSSKDRSVYDIDYQIIEELAEDLDVVQRHCGNFFDLPGEVTFKERVELRVARLLIQGHIVSHPGAKELTLVLDGQDSEQLRNDLSRPLLFVQRTSTDHEIRVSGKTLRIGPVYVVDPAAVVANRSEAIAALDRGSAEGFVVRVRPDANPYFCLALADRPPEQLDLRWQALWSLTGIDQPQPPVSTSTEAS